MFEVFDRNKDGCIDFGDLKGTLISFGESVTDTDVRKMIQCADMDGKGFLTYVEFVKMIIN